jgi:hypothetical protein
MSDQAQAALDELRGSRDYGQSSRGQEIRHTIAAQLAMPDQQR